MKEIPAERCLGGRELTEPRLSPDGRLLVYAESSAKSASLMLSSLDAAAPRQLTSYPQPRPGRGLGGGCWCWTPDSAAVVYCGADGNLWLQPVPRGHGRRLTGHGPERTAQGPMVTPGGDAVLYVIDQAEVWIQPFDNGDPRRLDGGSADFCFDPIAMPGGVDAVWQAWNVPDMAWDAARLERVALDGSGNASVQPDGALQQPRAMPDGTVICVRDDTGWNNVWLDGRPLVAEPVEHADPVWGFGQRSFAVSPDGIRVAFVRNVGGFGRLCVVDVASRSVTEVGQAVHGQLTWQGSRLAAIRTGPRTPTEIVVYDTDSWERVTIDVGPANGWGAEPLAEPELVQFSARDGSTLFARWFRADTESDRLLCWLHGGPTDQWQVTFMPRIAYWRSRGWNILVPDHRGSTGHGRAYQQAMNGRWGELDVTDTVDVIAAAHERGWGRPDRTVLMGGSAGGFTVLGVLGAAPQIAAAAVVSYPVTDLLDLAERSHRFERHYTHTLVAPLPASPADTITYIERSPVTFASRIRTPLLVFHGDADPVVPIEQSRALVDRIIEGGGTVELCVYEQEGHGFRDPEHQLDEYQRIERFLGEHIGADPVGPSERDRELPESEQPDRERPDRVAP